MADKKQKHPQPEYQSLVDLIESMGISVKYLAGVADINAYTLRMKLAGKPNYRFTEEDVSKLRTALCDISDKMKTQCLKRK